VILFAFYVIFILIIGKNKKLGLTGRPSGEIGLLATSKLYVMNEQMLAFIPQVKIIFEFFFPDLLIKTPLAYIDFCRSVYDFHSNPKISQVEFYVFSTKQYT
jgi:phosphorylase kinase alpha/beta subunit